MSLNINSTDIIMREITPNTTPNNSPRKPKADSVKDRIPTGGSPNISPTKRKFEDMKLCSSEESPQKKSRKNLFPNDSPTLTSSNTENFYFSKKEEKHRSEESSSSDSSMEEESSSLEDDLTFWNPMNEQKMAHVRNGPLVTEAIMDPQSPEAILVSTIAGILKDALEERHTPSKRDLFEIAAFAQNFFTNAKHMSQAQYLFATEEGLPRDIVIDPCKDRLFVLSREHSKLMAEGAERIVRNATLIKLLDDGVVHTQLAHIENIYEKDIDSFIQQAELSDEIYADIELQIQHDFKGKKKFSIFEEIYHGGIIQARKNHPLSFVDIQVIFSETVKQLNTLHGGGYYHGDIKADNILLKRLPNGNLKVKLADFGNVFKLESGNKWQRKDSMGYGSTYYSAPEYFGMDSFLTDEDEQAAAEDLYALGCVLYLLLFPENNEIPWSTPVDLAIKRTSALTQKNARIALEKERNKVLSCIQQERDNARLKLLETCFGLLDPNPIKRLTLPALMNS